MSQRPAYGHGQVQVGVVEEVSGLPVGGPRGKEFRRGLGLREMNVALNRNFSETGLREVSIRNR